MPEGGDGDDDGDGVVDDVDVKDDGDGGNVEHGGDGVVDDVDVDGDGNYVDVDDKNLSLLPLVEGAVEQPLPPLAKLIIHFNVFISANDDALHLSYVDHS